MRARQRGLPKYRLGLPLQVPYSTLVYTAVELLGCIRVWCLLEPTKLVRPNQAENMGVTFVVGRGVIRTTQAHILRTLLIYKSRCKPTWRGGEATCLEHHRV